MKSTGVIVCLTLIFGLLTAAAIAKNGWDTVLFILWHALGVVLFGATIYIATYGFFNRGRNHWVYSTIRGGVRIDDEIRTSESFDRDRCSS